MYLHVHLISFDSSSLHFYNQHYKYNGYIINGKKDKVGEKWVFINPYSENRRERNHEKDQKTFPGRPHDFFLSPGGPETKNFLGLA